MKAFTTNITQSSNLCDERVIYNELNTLDVLQRFITCEYMVYMVGNGEHVFEDIIPIIH